MVSKKHKYRDMIIKLNSGYIICGQLDKEKSSSSIICLKQGYTVENRKGVVSDYSHYLINIPINSIDYYMENIPVEDLK